MRRIYVIKDCSIVTSLKQFGPLRTEKDTENLDALRLSQCGSPSLRHWWLWWLSVTTWLFWQLGRQEGHMGMVHKIFPQQFSRYPSSHHHPVTLFLSEVTSNCKTNDFCIKNSEKHLQLPLGRINIYAKINVLFHHNSYLPYTPPSQWPHVPFHSSCRHKGTADRQWHSVQTRPYVTTNTHG